MIRSYESAALRIVQDDTLTVRARCLSLLELNRQARQEVPAEFAAAAVWGAARDFLVKDDVFPGDIVQQAIRRLRARQYVECPSCRRPLPDEDELRRWTELNHASWTTRGAGRRGAA